MKMSTNVQNERPTDLDQPNKENWANKEIILLFFVYLPNIHSFFRPSVCLPGSLSAIQPASQEFFLPSISPLFTHSTHAYYLVALDGRLGLHAYLRKARPRVLTLNLKWFHMNFFYNVWIIAESIINDLVRHSGYRMKLFAVHLYGKKGWEFVHKVIHTAGGKFCVFFLKRKFRY